MKKLLFSLFFAMLLVLGACGGGGDEGASDDNTSEEQTDQSSQDESGETAEESGGEGSESGSGDGATNTSAAEEVYQNSCASCHGGELGGGFGPALTEVGSKYDAAKIVDIIKNGQGQMPAQSQVSDEDAQTVADWLATME
ncbi:cytochrome C551 [Halobacillus halophilus]|uniref:Cytochrome c-551 n=1 Tax=Halobacillus halophilus (strain ATCC 35676 / DSM 2266 / JCM 20832 / KCTC 3685 / LMG 17431 / NBRC 102448 / NCIMB 2269) TaxID=866895 RepID=I0JQI8_HALH3|nr:cytochrome c [Halobacillus halophilus]ASF40420.1 cytochrome C551 [Halobacillus halophilus]CCG46408.1 cytochrome c-551 [Halobacillus halophilus DSM 2266]